MLLCSALLKSDLCNDFFFSGGSLRMSENQKGNKDVGCKGAMKSFSTLKDYLEFVNEENQLPSSSSTLATTLLMPNSLQPLEGKRKLEGLLHRTKQLRHFSFEHLCQSNVQRL